jgi:hypothetical protein
MHTCLSSVIMAIMKYGQSAMTLGETNLQEIQQPITHAILPELGYNRHTPCALVYATKQVGGTGMMNLYTEQGLSQIKYLMGGWQCDNDEKDTITTLVESYIISSGIITNPFEDDQIMIYNKSDWIDLIKRFLQMYKRSYNNR